ncbi:multidrug efflux MFS transporter [Streptococcus gallolyticus]|uniref:Predicted arabinose efflux permease, MFS family n=1 Tax=Streptococcus gallolyticus TaxID=315405 RepID=A0A1I7GMZ0_9STRE|nr:transporter, major facilitator family protein [Streptococcus gallolyticus subsp. gallolyticus TX20005]BAK28498.1 multidrug resistance efflux pump [Streptococcus gallolyticus subsp. gallolyticus ATCC 43143]CBZ48825.1 multi-drug resistance efflux pump [Streptococcus gallolyticus subsp. gallolyticus ATCC BAA-2069]SFC46523.1 Predicted arabinose efflux permease, MFS family [Streptococcus gallolyticus]SFU49833.1 Predicted arabinose efflux permease, MFS family [Streptococcus gallolyticus]
MRVAWLGNFFTGASFSLVMPFMALYVEQLGAPKNKVEWYAGLAVSLSALTSALIAPVWGRLADRYGRKPMMVRASLVMTFTMGGLAFVPNVFWLLVLRILNGLFSGYVPNSTALIASQAPKNRSGYALGTLATGVIGGSLVGPLLGGVLAEILGIRQVFLLVGFILLICNLMTVFLVKEDFQPVTKAEALSTRELFSSIKDKQILIGLFVTSMIIQVSAQSIAPILTLYIRHLGQTENLMFVSGLIVSALGFSSMLSSSTLGKIGDRIGNHRLLLIALFYSFSMYVLCALAQNSLQLGIVRFLYGFGTGALMPSINSLLTKITPREGISRIFSYNQMFMNMGQVIGPFIGSAIATGLGYRSVFYVTSLIVFVNFVWSLINFRKYLKVKEIV